MTIQEAIKSRKRFRRHSMKMDADVYEKTKGWIEPHHTMFQFERSDILATDWEIEEETVTITKERLKKALNSAFNYCHEINRNSSMYEALVKELGF